MSYKSEKRLDRMTQLPKKPFILFAGKYKSRHDGNIFFSHFYSHPETVKLASPSLGVFKVSCKIAAETEDSQYWGWYDFSRKDLVMIWPSKVQSDMCFPYGPKAEEERGRGKQVKVIVEELESV